MGIGVHVNVHRLPDQDAANLGLLEIGRDPDVIRPDGQERLPGLDAIARMDRAILDMAADLSANLGIAQTQPVALKLAQGPGEAGLSRLNRRHLTQ